jgi:hypothetical protein
MKLIKRKFKKQYSLEEKGPQKYAEAVRDQIRMKFCISYMQC